MANHKSAVKRHKQSLKRNARNRAVKTRMKSVIKDVRTAVLSKDVGAAAEAMTLATSVLAKAAGKGTIHKKKASRKISRLARAVNAISAANAASPA